jgi:hypothetical protein
VTTRQIIAFGVVAGVIGGIFIAFLGFAGATYETHALAFRPTPAPTATAIATASPTAVPSPTPTASALVWNAVLNSATNADTLNGYAPVSLTAHYLVVSLSFENTTSVSQTLDDQVLDLQDSSGQHYAEGQATNPTNSFVVQAGQSIQVQLAYVVPDSTCQFELDLVSNGGVQKTWAITSTYPGC